MTETQATVTDWAEQTFGPVTTPTVLVERAKLELDELLDAVRSGASDAIAHEMADVMILFYRLATITGFSIEQAIDQKMQINRARQWAPKGDGTGRHVSG